MYRSGHIGMSLLLYSPIALVLLFFSQFSLAAIGLLVVLFSTSIPDWDLWLPFVKHRGFTHTIFFAALYGLLWAVILSIGSYTLVSIPELADLFTIQLALVDIFAIGMFGLFIGFWAIISHLAADFITPMGLKPLQPFSDQRYGYTLARAKNPAANAALLSSGWIVTLVVWVLGIYLATGFDFDITISLSGTLPQFIIQGIMFILIVVFALLILADEAS